jgi:FecR protein
MRTTLFNTLLLTFFLYAGGSAWGAAGEVTHLSGTLSVKKADGASKLLSIKSQVQEGDLIATEADTYARIKFVDGGEVVLRPNTQLKVESYAFAKDNPKGDNVVLNMLKGGLRAVTGLIGKRSQDKVAYQTPTATIGIRGTHHGQLHCDNDCGGIPTVTGGPPANGLHVDVTDGSISLSNAAGQQIVNIGQFAYVANNTTAPVIVPPHQGIQITMPQSISRNRGGSRGIGGAGQTDCSP